MLVYVRITCAVGSHPRSLRISARRCWKMSEAPSSKRVEMWAVQNLKLGQDRLSGRPYKIQITSRKTCLDELCGHLTQNLFRRQFQDWYFSSGGHALTWQCFDIALGSRRNPTGISPFFHRRKDKTKLIAISHNNLAFLFWCYDVVQQLLECDDK